MWLSNGNDGGKGGGIRLAISTFVAAVPVVKYNTYVSYVRVRCRYNTQKILRQFSIVGRHGGVTHTERDS